MTVKPTPRRRTPTAKKTSPRAPKETSAATVPEAETVDTSGLEPVIVDPETAADPAGRPIVTVRPRPRKEAILILDGREWVVYAPKTMHATEMMTSLQTLQADVMSGDAGRRRAAVAALLELVTCVFSRTGHPDEDDEGAVLCQECDACAVRRLLRRGGATADLEDLVIAFGDLMQAWGLSGNRAQRRAQRG